MMDRVRAVALGNSPADILLKNGRVVDVLTETIYEADAIVKRMAKQNVEHHGMGTTIVVAIFNG